MKYLKTHIFHLISMAISLSLQTTYVIAAPAIENDAEVCRLSPGRLWKAAAIEITCRKSPYQMDEVNRNIDAYKLIFESQMFDFNERFTDNERHVILNDHQTKAKIADIRIGKNGTVRFEGATAQDHFVIQDLNVKGPLTIRGKGSVVLLKSVGSKQQVDVDAENLYVFHELFLNGTFSFKAKDPYFEVMLHPTIDSSVQQPTGLYSVKRSVRPVKTPSERQPSLSGIKSKRFDVSPEEYLEAYLAVKKEDLSQRDAFKGLQSNAEKNKYFWAHIHKNLTNEEKGDLGEYIYKKVYFRNRKKTEYHSREGKVGRNLFDGIHFGYDEMPFSPIKKIYVSEVKYCSSDAPRLGTRRVGRYDWRQLSVPYVEDVFKDMRRAGGDVLDIVKKLEENKDLIHLRLGVFSPKDMKLQIYKVGNMQQSLLD